MAKAKLENRDKWITRKAIPGVENPQPMAPGAPLEPERWEYFLSELAVHGVKARACEAADISGTAVYYRTVEDKEFADKVRVACAVGNQSLEREAYRRSVDGVETGVYWQGERVATERRYSDGLLTFMLKANCPEKYRDRQEVSVKTEGGASKTRDLSDEEVDQIIKRKLGMV